MSADLGRLRWRCRRGMKELDLVLAAYLECAYPGADPVEQKAFCRLLEASDCELWAWLCGQSCPDPELMKVVLSLRNCALWRSNPNPRG
ncbi:FAD assembly factor SdhE [Methylothermus subterraneus]